MCMSASESYGVDLQKKAHDTSDAVHLQMR
jgi:hypothetical protein